MRLYRTFPLLLFLFLATAAYADEVLLANGDRLTGTVVRKEGDELVFKTSYAGEIKIAWSQVVRIRTDEPMRVVLSNRQVVEAKQVGVPQKPPKKAAQSKAEPRPRSQSPGAPDFPEAVEPAPRPEAQAADSAAAPPPTGEPAIPIDTIAYINADAGIDLLGVRWKGRLNIGGSGNRGNSDTDTLHIDGEAVARQQRNRWTLQGSYDRSSDRDRLTARNIRATGKYDLFITERWYGYALVAFEKDKFRDIEQRTTIGSGIGHQLIDTDRTHLSLEGGLNYVRTEFDRAPDEDYPALRWATKYDQRLFGTDMQVFHNHVILTDLQDPEQTLVYMQTGLRLPLMQRLVATAQLNVDFDNAPASGKQKSDRVYLFTVGHQW
jgi:putative salt-induced outer membrane protein YdiY